MARFCRNAANAILYFHSKGIQIEDAVEEVSKLLADRNRIKRYENVNSDIYEFLSAGNLDRVPFGEILRAHKHIKSLACLAEKYSNALADDLLPATSNVYHYLSKIKREEKESSLSRQQAA